MNDFSVGNILSAKGLIILWRFFSKDMLPKVDPSCLCVMKFSAKDTLTLISKTYSSEIVNNIKHVRYMYVFLSKQGLVYYETGIDQVILFLDKFELVC